MLFQFFVVTLGSCGLLLVVAKEPGKGDSRCVLRCGQRRCCGRCHIAKDAEIRKNGHDVGTRSIFDGYLYVLKEEKQHTFGGKQSNWVGRSQDISV